MTRRHHLLAFVSLAALALVPYAGAQSLEVGAAGYNMDSGTQSFLSITVRSGILTQNGGTFHGTQGDDLYIIVGADLAHGYYNLNGGQVFAGGISLGSSIRFPGAGYMIQTGGEAYLSNGLNIATPLDSAGGYTLKNGFMLAPTVNMGGGSKDNETYLVLSGGTLATENISRSAKPGVAIVRLNGGVLRATGGGTLISSGITPYVGSGGAIIDLNGYNTQITPALLHDPEAETTDGGLTLRGNGTLTLGSLATYLGRTTLENGSTLRVNQTNTLQHSTLVMSGGKLEPGTGDELIIGGLAGSGDFVLPALVYAGRNGESTTYNGVLSGEGLFVKDGAGDLTLTRENTHMGGTSAFGGNLILAGTPTAGIGIIRGNLNILNGTVRANSVNALGYLDNAKVNNITITNGSLINGSDNDQGWGINYVLGSEGSLSSNGGVSSSTATSKFAFGGASGANTTVTVLDNSGASIAGRIDLRGDNGNTTTNFTVIGRSILVVTAAITSNGGVTGLTKLGSGTMFLLGSSTVNGAVAAKEGSLFVTGDGNMSNLDSVTIGVGARSEVTVSGTNSWWTSGGNLSLGEQGAGYLTIQSGARMSNTYAELGRQAGYGSVVVTGTGSRWDNSTSLTVGEKGNGLLTVTDGAQVTNTEARLGLEAGVSGIAYVIGAGSVWTSKQNMSLGQKGSGSLTVAQGGAVNVGSGSGVVTLGQDAGSSGTINIGGEVGSAPQAAGTLNASQVHGGAGNSKLVNFNHTGLITFNPMLSGALTVHQYSGTTQLAAANSFSGGTVIHGGEIRATNNASLGTSRVRVDGGVFRVGAGVTIGNEVILSGGQYLHTINGSLVGAMKATSDLGGMDVTAAILDGQTSASRTLVTSFAANSTALNDNVRLSDVYHLTGTATDVFVLELSFTSTVSGAVLGWLNNDNEWVGATLGNANSTATAAMLNYNGTWVEFLGVFQPTYGTGLGNYLGSYGYYTDPEHGTTSVWAVLNHNSAFATIPEPSTMALLAIGPIALLYRRYRQS